MRAVLVAVAAFLAWWLVRALARHLGGHADPSVPKRAGALFMDALLVGLLAARLGYVLRWWPEYAVAPWSILAIGDGGFLWWIGLPAALAFVGWRSAGQPQLRTPVLAGIAAGMLAWFALGATLALLQRSAPPLPDIAVVTLDGSHARLDASAGKPVVLNLWATWCPPCRAEMPVIEAAYQAHKDKGFRVLALDVREGQAEVAVYAQELGLSFPILLDQSGDVALAYRVQNLPRSFLIDRQGRVVRIHPGELTPETLERYLQELL